MIRKMIGIALVSLLFAGPLAFAASAQSTSDQPGQPAAPAKPKAAVKSHAAAKPKAAPEESAPVTGLDYPPCSKTVKDQCIQLWQRNLSQAYPQCAKVKGATSRAACIENAYKQKSG
ncbi:MAG TPA: hypothetical protein VJ487_18880 [Alphaproteobacteria bacterium]|nr:hypothetical protein [Alphaproteobacteria bacterium]